MSTKDTIDIEGDREGWKVSDCGTFVMITEYEITDGGYHEHRGGISVDKDKIDDVIEALRKVKS